MLNKSKDQSQTLPRIHSQKRVQTAFQIKDSKERFQRKIQPNNRQLKRTMSSNNHCKVVRYETTGILYNKKIAELKNKKQELDEEIKKIQQQIFMTKKSNINFQTKQRAIPEVTKTNFITQVTQPTSDSKISLTKNQNINSQKWIKGEIKIAENKLQILRKKIDQQTQKNTKMRKQVDSVRKQIVTLKNLNKNLQASLQKTNQQFITYSQLSKTLQEQIASKNTLMHKTKVQNQHKKAQLIKQYDQILRCLEKNLDSGINQQKSLKSQSQILYLTQYDQKLNQSEIKTTDRNTKFTQFSQKKQKTNINSQMITLKQKLEDYQKQFLQVKNQTGTKSTQQLIQKFNNKYQQNFKFYKYINELHQNLQQKQTQNQQLMVEKLKKLQQVSFRASQAKQEQIFNIKSSIESVRAAKEKYSTICKQYEQNVQKLKQIINQYFERIQITQNLNPNNISQQNIKIFLTAIRNKCAKLDQKFDKQSQKNQQIVDLDLAQLLQSARKQNNHENNDPKNQKLMNRQDFIKAREAFIKKKQTPRKPLSRR